MHDIEDNLEKLKNELSESIYEFLKSYSFKENTSISIHTIIIDNKRVFPEVMPYISKYIFDEMNNDKKEKLICIVHTI